MLDYAAARNRVLPDVVQKYVARDTIRSALGLGYGGDPLDAAALRFVFETDPAIARAAAFDWPILHGLCSYCMAARALLAISTMIRRACGGWRCALRQRSFPGEALTFDFLAAQRNRDRGARRCLRA